MWRVNGAVSHCLKWNCTIQGAYRVGGLAGAWGLVVLNWIITLRQWAIFKKKSTLHLYAAFAARHVQWRSRDGIFLDYEIKTCKVRLNFVFTIILRSVDSELIPRRASTPNLPRLNYRKSTSDYETASFVILRDVFFLCASKRIAHCQQLHITFGTFVIITIFTFLAIEWLSGLYLYLCRFECSIYRTFAW